MRVKEDTSLKYSETFTPDGPKEDTMKKIFAILVFFTALLLQGCAGPNVLCAKGCRAGTQYDAGWDAYVRQYNAAREQGQRIAPDGKTRLIPVRGEPGVFQDPNGYRVLHQLDCQREGLASRLFWGVFVPVASVGIDAPALQAAASRVGPVVQQQTATNRFYRCAELQEMLAAGNAVFHQYKTAEAQATLAQSAPVPQGSSVPVSGGPVEVQVVEQDPLALRHEAYCEKNWRACPAGQDWGTVINPDRPVRQGRYTCKCR